MMINNSIKAIVFDMDGVIIDSENLWKQAENEVFSSVGVKLTDEFCAITKSMTTTEVTKFWYNHFPWQGKSLKEIEKAVINRVGELISKKGKPISGINDFVKGLKSMGYKIGLATNSPACLIPVVLQRVELEHYFDATTSAEFEKMGKPHPSIYERIAKKLAVDPNNCVVIEDSESGITAARKAGMKTVLISNNCEFTNADKHVNSFLQIRLH
ncbi:hexitol phosphatase HxpB [Geofilum sp. OHC36d9]|uniref:hexitol phosphatase HxpB n=1 Tax=Geofilum sp. OHC36d9 TaxID=3458413 RepID=UPI0040331B7D